MSISSPLKGGLRGAKNHTKMKVTAVFDIGKTNKKILLFDQNFNIVSQNETHFDEVLDDDGFRCDDIERLEEWILETMNELTSSDEYDVTAVNFATYGATVVYLDKNGKRLTPLYNYEKPLNNPVDEDIYTRYGGKTEFCRKTASPALGSLNSGFQILDLKRSKQEVWEKVKHIIHFPQYLSYLLTGKITSEHTSIGCHTAMWDFDNMKYHPWLKDEGIDLPQPEDITKPALTGINGKTVKTGIGIHDSSASLVPYLKSAKENFVLISTGTWCINMNPFNHSPLTKEELENDCLNFLSINMKPVKSSRLFLGRIHDENVKRISRHFDVPFDFYKKIKADEELTTSLINSEPLFFKTGIPENYIDTSVDLVKFNDAEHAYHSLTVDLARKVKVAVDLVLDENNKIRHLYITGGFTRNNIFTKAVSLLYPDKQVFISEIDNATSLGAAMLLNDENTGTFDLGLTEIK